MPVSIFWVTKNFMTKFTFVFLLIHFRRKKKIQQHTYMCTVLLSNLKW